MFDTVNCGARRKSGKREIERKRNREGEILSRAIATSALVRRSSEKKKCQTVPSRAEISLAAVHVRP